MLNAAEIAKQADAMLAEREQEMKELEQQKRRARDIMFKKTQQLKVRPPKPTRPRKPHGLKPDVLLTVRRILRFFLENGRFGETNKNGNSRSQNWN